MSRINLIDRINRGVFILDGAMGTQLMARGTEVWGCNDYLNIESPEIVGDIHAAYFQAGSDAVITNTFGANKFALARHGKGGQVQEINFAGAQVARKAAGDNKYVLGDIGPCGDFLEPLGMIKTDELREAFAVQAKGQAAGGVDGFIIETMTALDEIVIAVEAVKSISDLPILVSLAFDPAGGQFKTMMGTSPVDAVERLASFGIAAVGFNCGTLDMAGYVNLSEVYTDAIGDKPIVLLAEPNAGRPELIDSEAIYTLSPEDFAKAAEQIRSLGAGVIGGCCGTSPGHIKVMAETLKQ